MYQTYGNSVGNNFKHVQITTKYRYNMMGKEKLKVFCRVAIEEACKKHKIEIEIINVQSDHVHLAVDCPRTMCDAMMMQIIKGLFSYILFRICPNLRKRYPQGHFWTAGYFCDGIGNSDFEQTYSYIENQDLHHA